MNTWCCLRGEECQPVNLTGNALRLLVRNKRSLLFNLSVSATGPVMWLPRTRLPRANRQPAIILNRDHPRLDFRDSVGEPQTENGRMPYNVAQTTSARRRGFGTGEEESAYAKNSDRDSRVVLPRFALRSMARHPHAGDSPDRRRQAEPYGAGTSDAGWEAR